LCDGVGHDTIKWRLVNRYELKAIYMHCNGDFVCVRALNVKRLELPISKLGIEIVYGSRSACVYREVRRSKVKVTPLSNVPAGVHG